MVDLKGQYESIKEEVNTSISEILDSSAFINGSHVHAFQKELEEYLQIPHVIPCANGTDALQLCMMGLGLKPGDEVITADFTFAATVEVIALLQLTPVLVDVEPDTFTIDPKAIEKAITPRTKAIVPVHLFGQCANMDAIRNLAQNYNLHIIEDNAQAMGATYTSSDNKTQKAGTLSHVAATSFFPSKNLGCYGDGGAVFTDNDALAHTIRGIANHGMYQRYYHDVIGVNSRLDSLQAAVLRAKLPHLDTYNQKRRTAAQYYSNALKGQPHVVLPKITCTCRKSYDLCRCHVFHQYTLRITNGTRDTLVQHFQENDVPCGVYYPVPLHRQKAYADTRYNEADFPVTNQLIQEVISLPMHTELEEEQLHHITSLIIDFVNR